MGHTQRNPQMGFDSAHRYIELPIAKLDAIIWEVKLILHHPSILYTRVERLIVKLQYAAIGLPAGRGRCAPFN